MSDGQVKEYSARLFFLERPVLFGNRTSNNLRFLPLIKNNCIKGPIRKTNLLKNLQPLIAHNNCVCACV